MDILIISQGGTGSTLLQRLLTLAIYIEKCAVINTHDLVNKFIWLDAQSNIKRDGKKKYGQSLIGIEEVLQKANRNISIVSRLSKDHVDHRNDDKKIFKAFVKFLQERFSNHIICTRENVFELSMSLAIKTKSNVYNVFSTEDRKAVQKIDHVDERQMLSMCDNYIRYLEWTKQYFPKAKVVSYERLITDTDTVISDLTGFNDTLIKYFGLSTSKLLRLEASNTVPTEIKQKKALLKYKNLCSNLIEQGILRETPTKNSSLTEKKKRIKNFDRCLRIFKQYTRNIDIIDNEKSTYDHWNKIGVDSSYRSSI